MPVRCYGTEITNWKIPYFSYSFSKNVLENRKGFINERDRERAPLCFHFLGLVKDLSSQAQGPVSPIGPNDVP
jgi:hypothetical protein